MALKHYETTFVIPPVIAEKEQQEIIRAYVTLLQEQDGVQIMYEGKPTFQKLAYPIKKQENGVYKTIEFMASPSFIQELELRYRRDERILRFLTVHLNEAEAQCQKEQREAPKKKSDNSVTK